MENGEEGYRLLCSRSPAWRAKTGRPDPPNFLGRNGSGRGDQLHQEVQFAKPKASATRRPTGPICGPDLALASQEVHLRFRLRVKGLSHP